jgi:hypothetical protein
MCLFFNKQNLRRFLVINKECELAYRIRSEVCVSDIHLLEGDFVSLEVAINFYSEHYPRLMIVEAQPQPFKVWKRNEYRKKCRPYIVKKVAISN